MCVISVSVDGRCEMLLHPGEKQQITPVSSDTNTSIMLHNKSNQKVFPLAQINRHVEQE